jgi:hypothetical protein
MRRYNHYGIPTTEVKENESYVEVGGFKFYSTPYEANEYHIQWHLFPEGHGLPEILTKVPHIAFQVDDLDKEIEGKKVILGPYYPLEGYRVAIIEEQGVPIEFIETKLNDKEVSELEQKNYEESAYKIRERE